MSLRAPKSRRSRKRNRFIPAPFLRPAVHSKLNDEPLILSDVARRSLELAALHAEEAKIPDEVDETPIEAKFMRDPEAEYFDDAQFEPHDDDEKGEEAAGGGGEEEEEAKEDEEGEEEAIELPESRADLKAMTKDEIVHLLVSLDDESEPDQLMKMKKDKLIRFAWSKVEEFNKQFEEEDQTEEDGKVEEEDQKPTKEDFDHEIEEMGEDWEEEPAFDTKAEEEEADGEELEIPATIHEFDGLTPEEQVQIILQACSDWEEEELVLMSVDELRKIALTEMYSSGDDEEDGEEEEEEH